MPKQDEKSRLKLLVGKISHMEGFQQRLKIIQDVYVYCQNSGPKSGPLCYNTIKAFFMAYALVKGFFTFIAFDKFFESFSQGYPVLSLNLTHYPVPDNQGKDEYLAAGRYIGKNEALI